MSMSLLRVLLIFIVSMFSALVFLGMWTYRDAKNRGLNAGGWTAIVILLPNLIGLLFYFLVGRKQSLENCKKCNAKIPENSKFCLNCGEEFSIVEKNIKPTSKLMKGFIVSIIIMVIAFVMFTISLFTENDLFTKDTLSKPGMSVASMEYNVGSKWRVSYYISTGESVTSIKIDENGPKKLYLESKSDEGKVYLKLVQDEMEEVIDVTNLSERTEVDLTKFKEGKVKLYLSNEEARGVKFTAEWE